jgi:integrase
MKQIETVLRRLNDLKNGCGFIIAKKLPKTPVQPQFTKALESYLTYWISIGNKENTIISKHRFCCEFFNNLIAAGCNDIGSINTSYICQAITKINNKDSFAVIRSLLLHLYETKVIFNDLSGIIPKYRRPVSLPTTYTDEEINQLETVIDQTTKTGKRNYAIFLLTSRLGIRAGDIADMTFNNIDLNRNRIDLIQEKTNQPLSLPILPEIRKAILDYIQDARPHTKNNYLFIRANAPFEKITTSAIRHALKGLFISASIDISNKKHGPHTLRSSMASSMVNSNVSYEVTRKALGHVDPQAIKRYAKVDIENLRLYAIDVPVPAGIFATILQWEERK